MITSMCFFFSFSLPTMTSIVYLGDIVHSSGCAEIISNKFNKYFKRFEFASFGFNSNIFFANLYLVLFRSEKSSAEMCVILMNHNDKNDNILS